jgi:hypothetical protein
VASAALATYPISTLSFFLTKETHVLHMYEYGTLKSVKVILRRRVGEEVEYWRE